jgi:hypothetical protein
MDSLLQTRNRFAGGAHFSAWRPDDYFHGVKALIEMSLGHCDGFVERCDPRSREYAVLKSGLIVRRPKAGHFERIVEIECLLEEAKALLDLAKQIYPDIIPDIEKALAAPVRYIDLIF